MQHRYTGDVGDFGKYGFLRWVLSDSDNIRLGINWYIAEPEQNSDGGAKVRRYLNDQPAYRNCDPDLYAVLNTVQRGEEIGRDEVARNVMSIHGSGIFPDSTSFFDDLLSYRGMHSIGKTALAERQRHREAWHSRALERLRDANVVFLDPDNGIERQSKKAHLKDGPKYVFHSELVEYIESGKTVILYQHAARKKGGFVSDLRSIMSEFKQHYGCRIGSPVCCRFRAVGTRAFVVLPNGASGRVIVPKARSIVQHQHWSRFFDLIS